MIADIKSLAKINVNPEDYNNIRNAGFRLQTEDVRLSKQTRCLISYEYSIIDDDCKYSITKLKEDEIFDYFAFVQFLTSNTIADIELNPNIKDYHFHETKGYQLKSFLKRKSIKNEFDGFSIDNETFSMHFSVNTTKSKNKARVHFIMGQYGVLYIFLYDPEHEVQLVKME